MSDLSAPPPATAGHTRNLNRIVFDLVLLTFLVVFVYLAFGLRPGSRLVPLIVAVPALVAMTVRTVLDVLQRGADYRRPEPADDGPGGSTDLRSASIMDLARAAQDEVDADNDVPSDDSSLRRQRMFALWCVAFVVVSIIGTSYLPPIFGLHTYFLPTAAIALLIIFRVIGLGWLKSVAITGAVTAFMYYMLVTFLSVRL